MITNKIRILWPALAEPKAFGNGDPKYGATILIDKNDADTISRIREELKAALEYGQAKGKAKGYTLETITKPIHDGDIEKADKDGYEGKFYINAKNTATRQPGTFGRDGEKLPPTDFYGGCYCRADIGFWVYEFAGNVGISCNLLGLQFVEDGEPIGFSGESKFDPLDDEPQGESNFGAMPRRTEKAEAKPTESAGDVVPEPKGETKPREARTTPSTDVFV